jgi:hypothetical protein
MREPDMTIERTEQSGAAYPLWKTTHVMIINLGPDKGCNILSGTQGCSITMWYEEKTQENKEANHIIVLCRRRRW